MTRVSYVVTMAGTDKKSEAGLPAAVKELLDKANGLLGLGEEAEKAEEAAKNPAVLTEQASKTAQAYRTTAKWVLGAFVAVGVVIFGSLPFAGLADIDINNKIWPVSIGLGLAVAGIAVAIGSAPMSSPRPPRSWRSICFIGRWCSSTRGWRRSEEPSGSPGG